MGDLTFVKDYKENKIIRSSLNELIQSNCGYSLEELYTKGYWQEQYIPYSFVDDSEVVANISICKQDVLDEGIHKSAISLEHILLHPQYHYQNLLEKLMYYIIEDYKEKVDFIYLIAHEAVTPVYTKLGFKYVEDRQVYIQVENIKKGQVPELKRVIEINEEIVKYPETFTILSKGVKCKNNIFKRNFKWLNIEEFEVYFLKEKDIYIMICFEEGVLNIIDILSKQEVDLDEVITAFKAIYKFDKVRLYSEICYRGCGSINEEVGSQLLFIKHFRPEEEEIFPIIVG